MDFDPGLNELELCPTDLTFKEFSFGNGNDGFIVLIFDVDVGRWCF